MKKLLPILVSVLMIIINVLPANAYNNVLRGVNVKKGENSYTVELTSIAPAKTTKTIVSANRILINVKDIAISTNLTTKFNGNAVIDNVMVEPCGANSVNILVQGDNVAYSDVIFKELSAVESVEDTVKSSFSSLFSIMSGSSSTHRGIQFGILGFFLLVLIGEVNFISSKYKEFQTEKEQMFKDIERTKDFKDYLPTYGKAGIKKPYTTPIFGNGVNTSIVVRNHMKNMRTPETLTLNTLLRTENYEDKIIDRIVNNNPTYGAVSSMTIDENVPPVKDNRVPVSNPLERARLKSNLRHLEQLTASYKSIKKAEDMTLNLRSRLNKVY